MNEEKKFIKPECEIIDFAIDDIITISDPAIAQGHTDDTPFW